LQYNDFFQDSVDQYIHPSIPGDSSLMPVRMLVTRYNVEFYNRTTHEYIYSNFNKLATTTEKYYIWEGNLGPLNQTGEALSSFFYSIVEIETEFQFENLDVGVFGPVPFLWHVYVRRRPCVVAAGTHGGGSGVLALTPSLTR